MIEVVYLLIPTSNHNYEIAEPETGGVVYLLIPTSNHNPSDDVPCEGVLYIF